MKKRLNITKSLSSYNLDWFLEDLESMEYSSATIYKANIAFEELLVNILNYSGSPTGAYVELEYEPEFLCVKLVDSGIKYNPIKRKINLIRHIETKIGGLGIFLTKELVDKITYKRVNDQNIVTFLIKNKPASKRKIM